MNFVSILRPKICGTERGVLPGHAKAVASNTLQCCYCCLLMVLSTQLISVFVLTENGLLHCHYTWERLVVSMSPQQSAPRVYGESVHHSNQHHVCLVSLCDHSNKYHVLTVSLCHHSNQHHVFIVSLCDHNNRPHV
jgi:hypothetical protein